MKIVLATPLYPPQGGGPATYARLLVEHSSDTIVLVKFSDVQNLPKVFRHVAYFFKVFAVARSADVVFALDPVSTGFPTFLAASVARKPFVVKIVGDYAWEQGRQRFGIIVDLDRFVRVGRVPFPVAFLRSIQTYVARRANRIIVPSHYLEKIVLAWGIPAEKISVIYNSIEIPELKEGQRAPERNSNIILTVARLVPWKGVSALIDAVELVRKHIPDAALLVIGDGPDKKKLKEQGQRALGNAVTFAGERSHEETLHAMLTSGIFVLNSSYEGLSHVLIEALWSGMPIVATDAGGNTEVIHNGENGIIVPVMDTRGLADELIRLMKDEDLRGRLGEHAASSSHRFSVPVMISLTHELLAACL